MDKFPNETDLYVLHVIKNDLDFKAEDLRHDRQPILVESFAKLEDHHCIKFKESKSYYYEIALAGLWLLFLYED